MNALVKAIRYERGKARDIIDAFGSMGFLCDENGRLWYFGKKREFFADPGDWIYLDAKGPNKCSDAEFKKRFSEVSA